MNPSDFFSDPNVQSGRDRAGIEQRNLKAVSVRLTRALVRREIATMLDAGKIFRGEAGCQMVARSRAAAPSSDMPQHVMMLEGR